MVNIAVVGAGYWGPNLIRNFNLVSNLTMVCDLDSARLEPIKKNYPNVTTTTNFEEVINSTEVDAVIIATPMKTHYKLAKAALEAGNHVFIEKPIAGSSKEAEELIDIAKKNNLKLMVGHIFEYSAPVNKIKELIDKGEIGKVYYMDSARVNLGLFQPDLSVVWDLAPHDLSIMFYLLGNVKPISVSAVGQNFIPGHVEDIAYITIKFENNIMAHFSVSWMAPAKLRRTSIVGTKKMIVYDDTEPEEKVKIYDKGIDYSHEEIQKLQILYRTGDIHSPKVSTEEPLRAEAQHFIDCIKNNKTPRSDGESGLRVVKIIEAAEKSIKENGKEVKLEWNIR